MQIEIWSDVVCPWCYIGKRRFDSALLRFVHRDEVDVTWRSFELDPSSPREVSGGNVEHLARKYGLDRDAAQAAQDRVVGIAEIEGLVFDFERARRGNSFDAHRLLHLARDHGVQHEMKERLMAAYLLEGQPIGDPETLEKLAIDVGLHPEDVRRVLLGDEYRQAVRADQAAAATLGITGVPFFVVDRAYGVAGAQSADLLLEVLETAWAAGAAEPD